MLDAIHSPADLKNLPESALPELARELRERIIDVTSKNGGHVAPNLGVVELSIALHRVFDVPRDSIVFDVSHQCYAHKILTGRGEKFSTLRKTDGISGFCNRSESESDAFGCGHAGTALSAALGIAAARDRLGGNEHVIAVVGDAAVTNGSTLEALNNLAAHTNRLIVVLNDNEWSIDRNVGAVAECLNRLITTDFYNGASSRVKRLIAKLPCGAHFIRAVSAWKQEKKQVITAGVSSLFENFKLRYLGPIDGHDIAQIISYLEFAKKSQRPILLHVRTTKGKGLPVAERHPDRFHGCAPYDPATGTPTNVSVAAPAPWQDAFGKTLLRLAKSDEKIVGITAAMSAGTGLCFLKKELPERYFDVGIAEGHAVIFAAGLASRGLKPCVAIYSSFMQRAVDMVMHDVCLQNLNVLFCLDRAGLSPQDGATHHGLFDIAMLRALPNLVIMQPKDEDSLADMMHTAFVRGGPMLIRYPRGSAPGVPVKDVPAMLEIGTAKIEEQGDDEICVWSLGSMMPTARALCAKIFEETGKRPTLTDARFVKPLDGALLAEQAKRAKLFITLEDHALAGGFGSAVLEELSARKISVPVERFGWQDKFVPHGSCVGDLRSRFGLDEASIARATLERIRAL